MRAHAQKFAVEHKLVDTLLTSFLGMAALEQRLGFGGVGAGGGCGLWGAMVGLQR
jgi:hypothetical protein